MGKFIVITGGTKGIGRAIAEKFAANGFDVGVCARKHDELAAMKSTMELHYGVKVETKPADMADKTQVHAFCDFVRSLKRPIDVLVNNAGYFVPGEISTEPEGTLESMMNANVYSAYWTTRSLIENLKQAHGHIFNMCSIASVKAYANGGSYAVTKFAMLGLSKCLREELKPHGVRVTAVMPGATKTASWEGVDLPDDRFMKVDDVADTVFSAYSLSKRSVVEEIIIRPQLGDI
jgi:hypothetical protein